ncbi:MAG: hypothetical protein AB7O66_09470 [Limisphaerales bacterium]
MNTLSTTPSLADCALPIPASSASASATVATRATRSRSPWRWFFLAFGILAAIAVFAIVSLILSFRMGGEARSIRKAVFAATPGEWKRDFEFGVGRLPAFLARAGFQFADSKLNLPPEAAAGIAAFRSADVGIYRRRGSSADLEATRTALGNVDDLMEARDWDSIVSVQEGSQSVRVFVPNSLSDPSDTRACVVVIERDQMVIVSARANLEPLLEIVRTKLAEQQFLHVH